MIYNLFTGIKNTIYKIYEEWITYESFKMKKLKRCKECGWNLIFKDNTNMKNKYCDICRDHD
jgi:hypothetical protein